MQTVFDLQKPEDVVKTLDVVTQLLSTNDALYGGVITLRRPDTQALFGYFYITTFGVLLADPGVTNIVLIAEQDISETFEAMLPYLARLELIPNEKLVTLYRPEA